MAPHGRELSEDLKDKIAALHKDGQGYKKISISLKLSCNIVAKVIQRFAKNRMTVNQSRQGRPRKMTASTIRQVPRLALQDRRKSATSIAEEISKTSGQTVSAQTIRRTVHQINLHGRRPRRKPLLKQVHKKVRKQFAEAHQSKPDDLLGLAACLVVWWNKDQLVWIWWGTVCMATTWWTVPRKLCLPTVKHGGGSIMVWGCMSAAGTGGIKFIDGIMDSTMYCNILKEKMVPSLQKLGKRGVFQHDNDPKHRSKQTTAFLKKRKVKVLKWPTMSPDLKPIKHLWGILKRKVEECRVSNIRQLREVITEEWKNIPAKTCATLVNSMLNRIKSVLKNNGSHTKYWHWCRF